MEIQPLSTLENFKNFKPLLVKSRFKSFLAGIASVLIHVI